MLILKRLPVWMEKIHILAIVCTPKLVSVPTTRELPCTSRPWPISFFLQWACQEYKLPAAKIELWASKMYACPIQKIQSVQYSLTATSVMQRHMLTMKYCTSVNWHLCICWPLLDTPTLIYDPLLACFLIFPRLFLTRDQRPSLLSIIKNNQRR